MAWPHFREEPEDKSPEGVRASTLKKLEAPSTCRVPAIGREVIYEDWLFRYTDWCDGCVELVFPTLAGTSFIVLLIWTLVTALTGASLASLIVGGAMAVIFATCTYLTLIGKGQMIHSDEVSYFFAERRMMRISRRNLRRARREARRLDAKNGWRPREGLPPGREEIYDRYLVEAHATDVGTVLGLRRWHVSEEDGVWLPGDELTETRWFEQTDGAEIGDYRAELEGRIPALEKLTQEELTTGRAREEFAVDQMRPRRELVEHINEQAAASI